MTIASPFVAGGQVSTISAGFPAAAAATAYDRKVSKWQALLSDHQLDVEIDSVSFQPIAITAMGAYDEWSLLWLKKFSDICASARGIDKGLAYSDLTKRISVALWRGNSRLLRALRTVSGAETGWLPRTWLIWMLSRYSIILVHRTFYFFRQNYFRIMLFITQYYSTLFVLIEISNNIHVISLNIL